MEVSLVEPRTARAAARRWLAALASLKLTLVFLALLGAGVVATYLGGAGSVWLLVLPLALFAVNLGCAVITNGVFRRQTALLTFHLALLAIVLLIAAGRLTFLKGQLELSTGETFRGDLTQFESGPWHPSRLAEISFTNHGFAIDYSPGVKRNQTRNTVSWNDESGRRRVAVIGDQQPLALKGYRFYTSFNKGFAPLFTWHPARGPARRGTVHLPAYPIHEYRQSREWTLPDTDVAVWVMLKFDEVLLDPARRSEFRVPREHTLVVRAGAERRELKPGERYMLPQGVLVYEGVTTWMGYNVFFDWTMPWLLAAGLLAVASLAWHFWNKFAARPWER
ncbi:MAG: cytochrome c biogenesis protein ResB [Betaproteobacteria bacterium]|nr:cytochrome c biogenesis protein ResB [Betaproteobacteria bacterium]